MEKSYKDYMKKGFAVIGINTDVGAMRKGDRVYSRTQSFVSHRPGPGTCFKTCLSGPGYADEFPHRQGRKGGEDRLWGPGLLGGARPPGYRIIIEG